MHFGQGADRARLHPWAFLSAMALPLSARRLRMGQVAWLCGYIVTAMAEGSSSRVGAGENEGCFGGGDLVPSPQFGCFEADWVS